MDKRPIGVFDSGLGGLTAVRQLMDQLPGEDIIYFGDTSRVPYGGRSQETVLKYTRQDINFLLQFDIKAIVIACNTADTAAGAQVQREYDLPICGAIRPTAKKAAMVTKNNRIGVIGTNATIRGRAYDGIIRGSIPGRRYGALRARCWCRWWRISGPVPEIWWWSRWCGSISSR